MRRADRILRACRSNGLKVLRHALRTDYAAFTALNVRDAVLSEIEQVIVKIRPICAGTESKVGGVSEPAQAEATTDSKLIENRLCTLTAALITL